MTFHHTFTITAAAVKSEKIGLYISWYIGSVMLPSSVTGTGLKKKRKENLGTVR